MILRYRKRDGVLMDFELGEKPITIGRSPDADLVLFDDKASRMHCGIRLWNDRFYIKDLNSKNGTYVNSQRIDMVELHQGDRIRVGSTVFTFEPGESKGQETILREVEDEMARGKGYSTLLREIVSDSGEQGRAAAAQGPLADSEEPPPTVSIPMDDKYLRAMQHPGALPQEPAARQRKIEVRKKPPKRG